jgi:hypothetical protein
MNLSDITFGVGGDTIPKMAAGDDVAWHEATGRAESAVSLLAEWATSKAIIYELPESLYGGVAGGLKTDQYQEQRLWGVYRGQREEGASGGRPLPL